MVKMCNIYINLEPLCHIVSNKHDQMNFGSIVSQNTFVQETDISWFCKGTGMSLWQKSNAWDVDTLEETLP